MSIEDASKGIGIGMGMIGMGIGLRFINDTFTDMRKTTTKSRGKPLKKTYPTHFKPIKFIKWKL